MQNKRRKPLRQHSRRRYPLAKTMGRMGLLASWGEINPTKGYRPWGRWDRFRLSMN